MYFRIPASPSRTSRKRPRSEPPSVSPVEYQSRLRQPRCRPSGLVPFTPPPILNPTRTGPGLYAHAKWKASSTTPNHTSSNQPGNRNGITKSQSYNNNNVLLKEKIFLAVDSTIPECDSVPHVNIGPQHQCIIPPFAKVGRDDREPSYEHLLWDPGISSACTEAESMNQPSFQFLIGV